MKKQSIIQFVTCTTSKLKKSETKAISIGSDMLFQMAKRITKASHFTLRGSFCLIIHLSVFHL